MSNPIKSVALFVAPSAYSLGGVQTWLDYLLPGIENHNYESWIALTKGQHHDVDAYLADHPFKNVVTLENKTGTLQGRINAIEDAIIKVQPDLTLVVNIADVYQAINNLRQRLATNTKVVTTIHGIHPGLIADIDLNHDVIDAVISTNKLTQKLINTKTGIDSFRSLYAPYGVATAVPVFNDNSNLKIAYVGRIEEDQKRINDLLKIFDGVLKELPNAEILVAGDGEDLSTFEAWLDDTGSPGNVKYLGVLDPSTLNEKIYSQADILILTSHWETGPIVAWEAMSHGLLLVSSRYIGSTEESSLVHNENCLMFDIGDIDGAIAQIVRASDTKLRKQLAESGLDLVETKYSIEKSVAAWANCLDTVRKHETRAFNASVPKRVDKGKLTHVFESLLGDVGISISEALRRFLRRKFLHQSAGSEWPHCTNAVESDSKVLSEYIE